MAQSSRPHVSVLRELDRHAAGSVLPERAVVVRTVQGNANRHVLAKVDNALVLLQGWKSDAHIWVSADDEIIGTAIADEIQGRVPRPVDERRRRRRVLGCAHRLANPGARCVSLERDSLSLPGRRSRRPILAGHVPHLDDGRRLILRRILFDSDDDERWTLFVLEDAEALLRKHERGAGGDPPGDRPARSMPRRGGVRATAGRSGRRTAGTTGRPGDDACRGHGGGAGREPVAAGGRRPVSVTPGGCVAEG